MDISGFEGAPFADYKGGRFCFCSEWCRDRFQKDPQKFSGEPLIRLENVEKIFKMGEVDTPALRGLNLRVWRGDFVAIIGSSGSGKSTALNMTGLLDVPTAGKIFLNGRDTSLLTDEERADLRSRTFGFVFQQYNLIPWLTAYENAALPLLFAGKKEDEAEILGRFEEIGIKERTEHRPFELSGGEQQRTAILRALANNPEVILGDEPTGNLDSKTGDIILELLVKMKNNDGKTLIIVTHDADIAERADQVLTFKDGKMVKDHQKYKKTYTE